MAYNWNWEVFFQPSATGEGTYLTWLLEGLKWTVTLALSAWIIALVIGSIIGVMRARPIPSVTEPPSVTVGLPSLKR